MNKSGAQPRRTSCDMQHTGLNFFIHQIFANFTGFSCHSLNYSYPEKGFFMLMITKCWLGPATKMIYPAERFLYDNIKGVLAGPSDTEIWIFHKFLYVKFLYRKVSRAQTAYT